MTSAPSTSLRSLLTLAWPVIISRSTQTIIGLADGIMVAKLGESALAATTTGAFNTFLVLILPMGVTFVVSSFSSQLFGRGDLAGARRYGFYGLGVALLTQLLALIALLPLDASLALLDHTPEVRTLMAEYMRIRLLSAAFAIGLEALGAYYGGLGNTKRPMVVNMVAMLLNVGLNWMLIEGRHGFPALGVAGAAWASVIASGVAFLGFLAVFLAEGRGVQRTPLLRREFVRLLWFGIPSGFNWFFEFLAFNLFINIAVAGLGTTALAAMMAVFQLNSTSFMPSFGLCSAGAILVGQAIGAGHKEEVPRIVGLTFKTAAAWQGLVGLSYLAVPLLLLAPFAHEGTTSEAFLVVGRRMLMLSAAWQLFDAVANTLAEALRAAGDTAFTMWARLVIAWAIFTPVAFLGIRKYGWGDVGAMLSVVLYLGLLAGVLWWRFRSGAWRRIELIEPAHG